jgi:hypothetical protein
VLISEENHPSNYLSHYGIIRRSGRYPWGSGGDWGSAGTRTPAQRSKSFFDRVEDLTSQGLDKKTIAVALGLGNTTNLRRAITMAGDAQKGADITMAERLKAKGLSNGEIGKRMPTNGRARNESSVRALLADGAKDKAMILTNLTNMLKEQVDTKGIIQIGSGVEQSINITRTKLDTAVAVLEADGYAVHRVQIDQAGTGRGKKTIVKVLAPPGTTYTYIKNNMDKVTLITPYSKDGGRTINDIKPPLNISSKRLAIRYDKDGGGAEDGVIYVRRGVEDVTLHGSNYAQVRIAIDGTHYIKGMAMYNDNLPKGIDLLFNTKKDSTGNKLDALKPMEKDKNGKIDPVNPFGANIRPQITRKDSKGNDVVISSMNKVNEEGDWAKWSKKLSSQTLSKQSPELAKSLLGQRYDKKKADLDEILRLTNPAVRIKLLDALADSADKSAVHLEAAGLPRTSWHAILPMNSLKENEIYAPKFRNGEQVALIRFPHAGTFEIPELIVNNKHQPAIKALGRNPLDAVAIHTKVAAHLSGADFDGDAVLVIPNDVMNPKIKTTLPLEGLKSFDHLREYKGYDGMTVMNSRTKGFEMGDISNLITDMTIQKAPRDELARAVRHSMVVIDAENHKLNWKQSALDNGIRDLKKKYQLEPGSKGRGGAATLISRAKSRKDVLQKKFKGVDPATGKKIFENTNNSYPQVRTTIDPVTGKKIYTETGKIIFRKVQSQKLIETDNAHTLLSGPNHEGTPIEKVYADHSNRLKALANEARKASVNTKTIPYSRSARLQYATEVSSLKAKLDLAYKNRPLERQAQIIAATTLATKRDASPNMDDETIKKVKFQALNEARNRMGTERHQIDFTPREWEAVQAGAITNHRLTEILKASNIESVRKMATPRVNTTMTTSKISRAKSMLAAGRTQAEVADALGIPVSTLNASIGRGEEG